jgi:hypothetical protein
MPGSIPETLRRRFFALLLAGLVISASGLFAQKQPPNATGKLTQEEAANRLQQFRHQRLIGDFTFQFELEHMPRRGESRIFQGLLWGTWNSAGPLMRARFSSVEGISSGKSIEMILQNGVQPHVWSRSLVSTLTTSSTQPPAFTSLPPQFWFKEFLPGVGYVPFDLLMPFMYWEKTTYLGAEKVKGRPAQIFLASPPVNFSVFGKKFKAVRYALDDSYNALLRVEILGPLNKPIRTFKILSFKKLEDNQWILKTIDLVNEVSRDKARFQIRAANVGNPHPPILFDPHYFAIPQPPSMKRF